jgi:hypothetical protein
MALVIEEITVTPNPIPPGSSFVRAFCRVSSDEPIESVVAYPPEGDPVPFQKLGEGVYAAQRNLETGLPRGTFDVAFVARDTAGHTVRQTVAVTIE